MMCNLPKLKYDYSALEPYIDALTMEIHYTKHHASYIKKLNVALENVEGFENKSIEWLCAHLTELPNEIRTAVRNNGGGHFNHSMFWNSITPNGIAPSSEFEKKLSVAFGSFDDFKTEFAKVALTRFGSGWAWLVVDGADLAVMSTPNQDNPVMQNKKPILALDVWEHAYYLKYQNKRADYVNGYFNVINWQYVEEMFNV